MGFRGRALGPLRQVILRDVPVGLKRRQPPVVLVPKTEPVPMPVLVGGGQLQPQTLDCFIFMEQNPAGPTPATDLTTAARKK